MVPPIPARNLAEVEPAASTPQGLIDRKALAFIAVERTRMPMVVTDPRQPDAPIVLANQAFLELTGYAAHEIVGRNCRFLQGANTDATCVAAIAAALAEQREITTELLNYRKDGSAFWNQLFISPVHDEGGELLYFFASQLDVTERRRAHDLEQAEHWLMREIDHRAKNALALVQGIVRLSGQEDAHDYARSVQGRVDALARAHALLADHRWHRVRLDDLLEGEAQPFGLGRVGFSGPVVELAANQVQPLGLLLHELLANAANHGALTTNVGTVTVTWGVTSDNVVRLEWQERGGPAPAQERIAGFGSKMIDGIVARQLRGSLALEWTNEGLDGVLTVPVAA